MNEIYAVVRHVFSGGSVIIATYTTYEQAELHADKAMGWRRENRAKLGLSLTDNLPKRARITNPYDPTHQEDNTYIFYLISNGFPSSPFRHLDEFLESTDQ